MKSSDDDIMTLSLLAVGIIMMLGSAGVLAVLSDRVRTWLVEHHVLVTESVVVPLTGGAGLDVLRIVILVAAVGIIFALVIMIANAFGKSKEGTRR